MEQTEPKLQTWMMFINGPAASAVYLVVADTPRQAQAELWDFLKTSTPEVPADRRTELVGAATIRRATAVSIGDLEADAPGVAGQMTLWA